MNSLNDTLISLRTQDKGIAMNSEVAFIKACKYEGEPDWGLQPAYAQALQLFKKVVQIDLDLNVLIAMEHLSESATLEDVKSIGLYPLYELLNNSNVTMAAIGVHECPEYRVPKAHEAYDRFCRKFWPKSVDDPQATRLEISSPPRMVSQFSDLSEDRRLFYGPTYISMLQIQNILKRHSSLNPEDQFSIYFHSMIQFIDRLHAFDTEIAKYAFWKIQNNTHQNLPKAVRDRRTAIRKNFVKVKGDLKQNCLNSAMDIMHVSGGVLAEDIKHKLFEHETEHWLATMDEKLVTVCKDIYHIYNSSFNSSCLISNKEPEMMEFSYWQYVEALARNITLTRKQMGYNKATHEELVKRIDNAVNHLEQELEI